MSEHHRNLDTVEKTDLSSESTLLTLFSRLIQTVSLAGGIGMSEAM